MTDPTNGTPTPPPEAPKPPPAAPPPPPPASPPPTATQGGGGAGSDNRTIMIVLAYLGLLALIPLLVEKDDPEVQWHAKHGLVLTVAWVAVFIALGLLNMVISAALPGVGCLGCFLPIGAFIAVVIVQGLCIVKGIKGERFLIPTVSDFANRW